MSHQQYSWRKFFVPALHCEVRDGFFSFVFSCFCFVPVSLRHLWPWSPWTNQSSCPKSHRGMVGLHQQFSLAGQAALHLRNCLISLISLVLSLSRFPLFLGKPAEFPSHRSPLTGLLYHTCWWPAKRWLCPTSCWPEGKRWAAFGTFQIQLKYQGQEALSGTSSWKCQACRLRVDSIEKVGIQLLRWARTYWEFLQLWRFASSRKLPLCEWWSFKNSKPFCQDQWSIGLWTLSEIQDLNLHWISANDQNFSSTPCISPPLVP